MLGQVTPVMVFLRGLTAMMTRQRIRARHPSRPDFIIHLFKGIHMVRVSPFMFGRILSRVDSSLFRLLVTGFRYLEFFGFTVASCSCFAFCRACVSGHSCLTRFAVVIREHVRFARIGLIISKLTRFAFGHEAITACSPFVKLRERFDFFTTRTAFGKIDFRHGSYSYYGLCSEPFAGTIPSAARLF